tara:strand:+ start:2214 stop:2579 length:366 start_codon:yes stop_codon:yes gene_type:complete
MALTGGGGGSGGAGGTRGALADAPYQAGTMISIQNTSSSNNVTVYTVPNGKKFIGMIQQRDYRSFQVNDVESPRYMNGVYGSGSVLYHVNNVKQHFVAGTVIKKHGSYGQELNILGVESDA